MLAPKFANSVAVITLDNPPVNALSVTKGFVQALCESFRQAIAERDCKAIVVNANGRIFCAGADIMDFDVRPDAIDEIRALMTIIESGEKPVVMAMHGMALGGGLEVAMSGHYRICTPGCQFGLPEIALGLLPGGGGTQRLPRLAGADIALDMMLSGKSINAETAMKVGLVDRIAESNLLPSAIEFAREIMNEPPRRTKDRRVPERAGFSPVHREKIQKYSGKAASYIVECIEAAWDLDFEDALVLEKEKFEELRLSEESRGLRHVFFGTREVSHIPVPTAEKSAIAIRSAAVIGAGVMGTGIAIALLNAGLTVKLVEVREDALRNAGTSIQRAIQRDAEKGRISLEEAQKRLDQFSVSSSISSIAEADVVIEAVFEDMAIKRSVFTQIDTFAKPTALLASNTSTLNLDVIAEFTRRPEQVVGLHFFSPANVMKLLEIVRGQKTLPSVLVTAMNFAKAIGKVGVVSGVCDGFIGNRMFEEYLRQAYFLLEEGALPHQIDQALEHWGMAMGPLKVMDLAGQDIGWSIRKRRAQEQPERPYSKIPDLICEMGRFGQKTKAGYYLYPDGRTAKIDPTIDALIIQHARSLGVQRRKIADDEIIERCILALVNEGAKILQEGIAYRAVDIDMVYVKGYGFPAERGGPMFYADRVGLDHVLNKIRQFETGSHGWAWEAAPLLSEFAAKGRSLENFPQGYVTGL